MHLVATLAQGDVVPGIVFSTIILSPCMHIQ